MIRRSGDSVTRFLASVPESTRLKSTLAVSEVDGTGVGTGVGVDG